MAAVCRCGKMMPDATRAADGIKEQEWDYSRAIPFLVREICVHGKTTLENVTAMSYPGDDVTYEEARRDKRSSDD